MPILKEGNYIGRMKYYFVICACLWALLGSPVHAYAADSDVVVVRVQDGGGGDVRCVVTRGEGKSEEVVFKSGYKATSLGIAAEGYHKLIARLYQEGYVLQGTVSTGAGLTSTLFFVKAAKP